VSFSEEGLTQMLKEGIPTEPDGSAEKLTAYIQESRNRIEVLERQFVTQGVELTKQYSALEARRTKLKASDAAAVERFNAEAAAYQAQNAAHKAVAQELETARQTLQTLLDKRSKLQQAAKPASSSATGKSSSASGKSVILYTTSSCPACSAAKSYFARKGVSYDERDVNSSPAAMQEFRQLGGRGVPLILVGSERMEGFNARRLDQLL
jgi:glutaredoxin